ncbi:MAG: hypothetical protein Q8J62_07195 [Candidatus Cloacimonadaceae bacterium]|nr:hypothetical protein [Candidatus Cloacimonadaceae bacterium]
MRYKEVFVMVLFVLLFLTACDSDLMKPGSYLPDNANQEPLFNRSSLMSQDGNCYIGYRNYNIRPDRVSLTWQESNDDNFLCYKLLRNNQLIGNIYSKANTSSIDSLLTHNTVYRYSVATQVRTGLSKIDTLTVKTASRLAPEIMFRVNINNQVIISWRDRSDIPGSFKLFRDNVLLAAANEVLPANPNYVYTYQDNAVVQYNTYSYRLQKIGLMDDTPLTAPANVYVNYRMQSPNLQSLQQTGSTPAVRLNWSETCNSETGFRIYRELVGGTVFQLVGTLNVTNQTQYIDEYNLAIGNTYRYYITAIDTDTTPIYETPPSNIRSITLIENVLVQWKVALLDSYGDGWNGGYLFVFVNGIPVHSYVTIDDGYGPQYHTFDVTNGDLITTYYSPGEWPSENYYAIIDHNNQIVAQSGGTWTNPGYSTPQSITTTIVVIIGGKLLASIDSVIGGEQ